MFVHKHFKAWEVILGPAHVCMCVCVCMHVWVYVSVFMYTCADMCACECDCGEENKATQASHLEKASVSGRGAFSAAGGSSLSCFCCRCLFVWLSVYAQHVLTVCARFIMYPMWFQALLVLCMRSSLLSTVLWQIATQKGSAAFKLCQPTLVQIMLSFPPSNSIALAPCTSEV